MSLTDTVNQRKFIWDDINGEKHLHVVNWKNITRTNFMKSLKFIRFFEEFSSVKKFILTIEYEQSYCLKISMSYIIFFKKKIRQFFKHLP